LRSAVIDIVFFLICLRKRVALSRDVVQQGPVQAKRRGAMLRRI